LVVLYFLCSIITLIASAAHTQWSVLYVFGI
jgi:hypothetical protein